MAQLKDSLVSGNLRVTDTLITTTAQLQILKVPATSGGTTYGVGTNGQVVRSNGTSTYWATLGTVVDKAAVDRTSATTISSSGTDILTERAVYYGLPTINYTHNYNSSSNIYAPTTSGNSNQYLVSGGANTAPSWASTSKGAMYVSSANGAFTFGTLGVDYGGTGIASVSANAVLVGNNATTLKTIATAKGAFYATDTNGAPSFATLPTSCGGTGLTTSTNVNAVVIGNSTTATNAMQTVRTASGAFYATEPDAKPQFGTLPIAQGGTGGTSKSEVHTNLQYVYSTGDTMTGTLTTHGLIGTEDIDYGQTLPLSPSEGQIFFQISDPWYEIPNGGSTGQALVKRSGVDRDVTWGAVGGIMTPDNSSTYYVTGSLYSTENTDPAIFNTNIYVSSSVLFGAAWNDYAEYRETKEIIEPGRCIIENGDGSLSLSTKRLQGGAEIVSDTFGFAIGKTDKCGTPIAVSGRVLAYMNESIEQLKIGAPVCSGPNGTVSQMTPYEARKYPWLILGTISSIPKEKEWGANNVKVNGRVWIRVR